MKQRGITTLLVISFMGIFLLILATLTSYAFQQSRYGRALYGREQALHIAEAGLEYYRWYLAHFPGSLSNTSHTVVDPEGTTLGSAALTITGNSQCNVVQSIDIVSRGTALQNPGYPRTIAARYMRKSVAAYSYLLNSSVWAGSDRVITGPYFSNGGIRMDGSNNSNVGSAVTTWSCDSSFGCSPTQTQPGVFGAGPNSTLWSYPESSIDFSAIAVNLSSLKTYAQNNGGRYYAQATGSNADRRGYHVIFKSNGTYDLYRVSNTTQVTGYTEQTGWVAEHSIISSQTLLASNVTIPSSCSVLFFEDRVWIEGVVSGKVTLVAATPSDTGTSPDVYLMNNITYATSDGSSGLTVIAERNINIPLNSPDVMEIRGIFIAQGGRYGRNHYTTSGSNEVPSAYDSYVLQSQLTTVGTVVSNYRTGTSWSSGSTVTSGYLSRIDAYDQLQATNPPPFTPYATTDFKFVLWREL